MKRLNVATRRGSVLNGALFDTPGADTVLVNITGIHGNFCSNPFYYDFGAALNSGGFDFVYAQTNDAFGQIPTVNARTGERELIGSWNERFSYTDEDIEAYLDWAQDAGYKHVFLSGHSLGANKVMYYLSRHHDGPVEKFVLLSPANLSFMMSGVSKREKETVKFYVEQGRGNEMLPFPFMGWVECIADTAHDWLFSGYLDNAHTAPASDFSVAKGVTHSGALLIGTYDNFAGGDPARFLHNVNDHMPTAAQNKMIFIEKTGHTYQMKHRETAEALLSLMKEWRGN